LTVGLAEPDGLAAVGVLGQRVVHGHVSGVPMVVEDAPLDAARDPGAEHPDQGGLDDVLAIEDLVVVRLIGRIEKPPAQLRQDAQLDVLVLQVQGLVGLLLADIRHAVLHGVGIDAFLSPLVGLVRVEARIDVRRVQPVRRQRQRLLPHLHGPRRGGGNEQNEKTQQTGRQLLGHEVATPFRHGGSLRCRRALL
jgi:hypothetical protein